MREVALPQRSGSLENASFAACLATILELELEQVPETPPDEEVAGFRLTRWLGGLGLGLAPVAEPANFAWAGPWLARVRSGGLDELRAVVMFGVPPGIAWDPSAAVAAGDWVLVDGFVVAALDVALAMPGPQAAPTTVGAVEGIFIAESAGRLPQMPTSVRALAGRGLDGDRHVSGHGTFPSGGSGSALTLIEAEVCESFSPALAPVEHRRNLLTRGIDLNSLVGREFAIGEVRCRGMRLCEPCRVVDGYASRPILRPLVHRGGLRADILSNGSISLGDRITSL